MTAYYIHLGYDFKSYTIGSVWKGSSTNTNYWLQYCLATNQTINQTGAAWNPALFQFLNNDTIYFKIWDLTDYSNPDDISIAVDASGNSGIGLCQTTGTVYTNTNSPIDISKASGLAWNQDSKVNNNWYIKFNSFSMSAASQQQSPWGQSNFSSTNTIGPMRVWVAPPSGSTTTPSMSFKMSFRLYVGYSTDAITYNYETFTADPETALGSGRQITPP